MVKRRDQTDQWRPRHGLLLVYVSFLSILGGCSAATRVTSFDEFSRVGASYADAIDALLVESGRVLVDTNSRKLLENQALGTVSSESLAAQDAAMRTHLEEVRLLRQQARNLSTYFEALAALAASEASSAFAKECAGAANAVAGLTERLGNGALGAAINAKEKLLAGMGRLIIHSTQAKALNRELEARKEIIARALVLQELLVQALEQQVRSDLSLRRRLIYDKEITGPFLEGSLGADSDRVDAWSARRWELLATPELVNELAAAKESAGALRRAWFKLLDNRLEPSDLSEIAGQLEPVLAALGED